ncbi:hypothetical protein COB87_000740 [Candidatus Wolfebacteria bacterium]|nr:hypothetical protein [Candidatus Wolfebacteria bacterium]
MKRNFIGSQNIGGVLLPYENALIYYVYGRVTLNVEYFLFILPSIFYFYHHAIEISLKTALSLKNIEYPTKGMKGHRIYDLLLLMINNGSFSERINNIQNKSEMMNTLSEMDNSYMNNKYNYPGYQISRLSLRDDMDELIFVLFEEINSILKTKTPKHALAILNIPKSVEQVFLLGLKKPFSYKIISALED